QAHAAGRGGDGDGALGVGPPRAVIGLGQALLAEQLAPRLHVAVRLGERLLGVHHAGAGGLAEGLYVLGGEVGHRASGLLGLGRVGCGGGLGLGGGGGLGGRRRGLGRRRGGGRGLGGGGGLGRGSRGLGGGGLGRGGRGLGGGSGGRTGRRAAG